MKHIFVLPHQPHQLRPDLGPRARQIHRLEADALVGVMARDGGEVEVAVVARVEQDAGHGQVPRIRVMPHVGEHPLLLLIGVLNHRVGEIFGVDELAVLE